MQILIVFLIPYSLFVFRLEKCFAHLLPKYFRNYNNCCFSFRFWEKYSKQGNCLRLFSLQSVSADAMRKVFDNPDDFEDKKTRLKQYCKSNLTNPRNNELLSRKVVFCGFYTFA